MRTPTSSVGRRVVAIGSIVVCSKTYRNASNDIGARWASTATLRLYAGWPQKHNQLFRLATMVRTNRGISPPCPLRRCLHSCLVFYS